MSDFKKYLNRYVFDTVLPGSGKKIEFKPITTGQMKQLLAYENETDPGKIEEILDDLIEECVIDEKFDIKQQYIQDRFFLMVEMRKYTKGSVYQFEYKCPDCESQSLQTVDINKLKVTKLKKGKKSNTVSIDDNISIDMDYPTRQNQIDAYTLLNLEEFSTGRQQSELGVALTAATITSITTPEGTQTDVPLEDRVYLLDNITQEMYEKIGEWTKSFGIDFIVKIKCPQCTHSQTIDIPPENFFF